MSFVNILKFSYWFAISTPPLRRSSFIVALAVLAILLVAVIVLKIFSSNCRGNPPLSRALHRLARPIFFLVILGGVLITFRQLGALVLSARAWLALVDILAIAWFVVVLRRVCKTYKMEFSQMRERSKYEAYLPKRNNR